jgi:hypothetical protein
MQVQVQNSIKVFSNLKHHEDVSPAFIISFIHPFLSYHHIFNQSHWKHAEVEEIKRDLDLNREIRLYLNQSRVSELVVFEIEIGAQ